MSDAHAPAVHHDAHHADHHGESLFDLEDRFTDDEWNAFRREDKKAATAVVALMLAIFGIGVVLYSIVVATL